MFSHLAVERDGDRQSAAIQHPWSARHPCAHGHKSTGDAHRVAGGGRPISGQTLPEGRRRTGGRFSRLGATGTT